MDRLKLSMMLAVFATGEISLPLQCFALSTDSDSKPENVQTDSKPDKIQTKPENAQTDSKSDKVQTNANDYEYVTDLKNGEIYKKGVGLSGEELHLLNQGRFVELADKLSSEIHYEGGAVNRKQVWLAFAYLYLQVLPPQ
jgi:hypothetical protein